MAFAACSASASSHDDGSPSSSVCPPCGRAVLLCFLLSLISSPKKKNEEVVITLLTDGWKDLSVDGWCVDDSGGKLVRIRSRLRSDQTLPVFFQRKGWGSGDPAVGFGGGCFRFARCCCTAVWFALMSLGRLLIVSQND